MTLTSLQPRQQLGDSLGLVAIGRVGRMEAEGHAGAMLPEPRQPSEREHNSPLNHGDAVRHHVRSPLCPPQTVHPGEPSVPHSLLHYRIRYALGRGVSGEALLAYDERLHRDVVLKLLVSGDHDHSSVMQEARILAQLTHPNIAGLHAVETTGDETFLVLEYVDGETLERVLSGGPLPPSAVLALTHTLLSALAHAHSRGVLHRDLKPDNILIAQDGTVKLADFGVAHIQGLPATRSSSQSLYQSPEQARGQQVDGRSDLYSLALILIECATGSRVAREAGVPLAPEQIKSLAARLPDAIADSITACLAPRPEDRPDSALTLLATTTVEATPGHRGPTLRWAAALGALLLATMALAWRFEWLPNLDSTDPMTLAVVPATSSRMGTMTRALSDAYASAVVAHLAQVSGIRQVDVPLSPRFASDDLAVVAAAARRRGAGRVLLVDLRRRDGGVQSQLTLVDTRDRRVLWADARRLDDGALPRSVAATSRDVARAMGALFTQRYEWFLHVFSDSLMAGDPFARAAMDAARGGDIPQYLRAARNFLAEHPTSVDAHVLMAYAQLSRNWELGPLDPVSRRAFVEAIDSLQAIDPRSPWDEALSALMLSRDGELDAAISAFSSVLANPSLGPSGRAMVLGFRGQALRDRGESGPSLRDLREAAALDGTNSVTLVIFADALGTFGHEHEGLDVALRAVALAPHRAHSHTAVAQAHGRLGRWQEAEAAVREAHRIVPSMDTQSLLALSLLKQDRGVAGAIEAQAAAQRVETAWGRSTLARYHAARGDQDAALRELSRAAALGFADPEVERIRDFEALRAQPRFAAMWAKARRQ